MLDDLSRVVLKQAEADENLDVAAQLLVLGALDGDAELDEAVATIASEAQITVLSSSSVPGTSTADDDAATDPARAYLAAVTVAGFRGVGPAATLRLTPGPGLTVVAGRNGCGKSSFAEALEVALTRESHRWKKRTAAVWSGAWRNLHDGESPTVRVELAEEGRGRTTVEATWPAGAKDFGTVQVWSQRPGRKRGDLAALGWDDAMVTVRPFLSYDELGTLFDEPSKLYDAVASVLGLGRLDDALKRLTARHKLESVPKDEATARKRAALDVLESCPDPRAPQLRTLLRSRTPDLVALAEFAPGTAPEDPALSAIRRIADLTPPDVAAALAARQRVRAARAALEEATRDAVAAASMTSGLLKAALEHRERHGEGPCPVCGVGILDDAWAQTARSAVDKAGLFTDAVSAKDEDLRQALAALDRLAPAAPPILATAVADHGTDIPSAAPAEIAWTTWRTRTLALDLPDEDGEAAARTLCELLVTMNEQATAAVQAREDVWRPVALALATWLASAQRAEDVAPIVTALKPAQDWLKESLDDLRNARLRPIADQARHIWAQLRQESNVDLCGLHLAGTANRRHLSFQASVDDTAETEAFSVMSQGELHALALALFLPRATAGDSPFGFVVIDDPVQAMDPAKVDGLAQVLSEAARTRQVVVFTHDDRLPEAVRRLRIEARIVEVTRAPGSVVTVTEASLPHQRYLDDARAVASDPGVPTDVAARVVPQLCRLALESACRDMHYRRALGAGRPRHEVEAEWQGLQRTRPRVTLAVRGSADADLTPWLRVAERARALGICSSAPHQGLSGSARQAITDVERTISALGTP